VDGTEEQARRVCAEYDATQLAVPAEFTTVPAVPAVAQKEAERPAPRSDG
jgi:hypothetical protein